MIYREHSRLKKSNRFPEVLRQCISGTKDIQLFLDKKPRFVADELLRIADVRAATDPVFPERLGERLCRGSSRTRGPGAPAGARPAGRPPGQARGGLCLLRPLSGNLHRSRPVSCTWRALEKVKTNHRWFSALRSRLGNRKKKVARLYYSCSMKVICPEICAQSKNEEAVGKDQEESASVRALR